MKAGRFLRENTFLVAAVVLPMVVVAFFIAASVVPKWLVPPPQYDLLFRIGKAYESPVSRVAIDFSVAGGRIEANVRGLKTTDYVQSYSLLIFEHQTMTAREITIDVPKDLAEGESRTVAVDSLAGRRVLLQPKAPDGYQLQPLDRHGAGIVGDLFGMRRYDQPASLVNRGRVVPIDVPTAQYYTPAYALGWLVDDDHK